MSRPHSSRALFLALGLSLWGCTTALGGDASFPVMSRNPLPGYDERVASVEEERCSYLLLLVLWGEEANHEAVVTDLLARYDGDAITNAELTFEWVDALVYRHFCARVKGDIVRRRARAEVAPVRSEETALR
jgi:hypothetical protein